MSDIAEFERRITVALERIDAGIDAGLDVATAGASPDNSAEISELNTALEAERMANAQLEERVSAIKDKQETTMKEMQERIEALGESLTAQESQARDLEQANNELQTQNQELRSANEKSVGEADQTSKAMQAELETLQATRKADLSELETIMAELKPIIAGGV